MRVVESIPQPLPCARDDFFTPTAPMHGSSAVLPRCLWWLSHSLRAARQAHVATHATRRFLPGLRDSSSSHCGRTLLPPRRRARERCGARGEWPQVAPSAAAALLALALAVALLATLLAKYAVPRVAGARCGRVLPLVLLATLAALLILMQALAASPLCCSPHARLVAALAAPYTLWACMAALQHLPASPCTRHSLLSSHEWVLVRSHASATALMPPQPAPRLRHTPRHSLRACMQLPGLLLSTLSVCASAVSQYELFLGRMHWAPRGAPADDAQRACACQPPSPAAAALQPAALEWLVSGAASGTACVVEGGVGGAAGGHRFVPAACADVAQRLRQLGAVHSATLALAACYACTLLAGWQPPVARAVGAAARPPPALWLQLCGALLAAVAAAWALVALELGYEVAGAAQACMHGDRGASAHIAAWQLPMQPPEDVLQESGAGILSEIHRPPFAVHLDIPPSAFA
jgi:hypothetical protein